MSHSTSTPTKAEQGWMDAIHAMDCIACEIEKTLTWEIVGQNDDARMVRVELVPTSKRNRKRYGMT